MNFRRPGRAPDLRLIVVTDSRLAAPRAITEIVIEALAGGAPAIQLRDKEATPRELAGQAMTLLPHVRAAGALLFINDRIDVALACGADGAHIGPSDIPLRDARRITPPGFLLGFSTDDPAAAKAAEQQGASYIGCGAVFGTTTKREVGDERIGTRRLDDVARAVSIPVIGIGGISAANVSQVAATGAAGAAVVGAIMKAPDPSAVTAQLLEAFLTRER
jgi:thiamine-phosphate pyrophosphorylase